jgi:hypothetical protein
MGLAAVKVIQVRVQSFHQRTIQRPVLLHLVLARFNVWRRLMAVLLIRAGKKLAAFG